MGWVFTPLLLIGGYFNGKLVETEGHESVSEEHASTIVFQAVSNIRTVCNFGLQEIFVKQFTRDLDRIYV